MGDLFELFDPEQLAVMIWDSTSASKQFKACPRGSLDELTLPELRVVACFVRTAHQSAKQEGMPVGVLDILEGWYYEVLGVLMPHDRLLQDAVMNRKHVPISNQGSPNAWGKLDALLEQQH